MDGSGDRLGSVLGTVSILLTFHPQPVLFCSVLPLVLTFVLVSVGTSTHTSLEPLAVGPALAPHVPRLVTQTL